jgi:hypothetical protein
MTGFETRIGAALRENIRDLMGEYIPEMASIDFTKPAAVVLAAAARERYDTFEEVLFLIEDLEKKLSNN